MDGDEHEGLVNLVEASNGKMAETREFDVIRVARSDGADMGPGYWPAAAASTTAATKKPVKETGPGSEKAPRTKPQMVRLTEDDPRFFEWRIKLGILLKQELAPNPEGKAHRQRILQ